MTIQQPSSTSPSAPVALQRSPWHSPVPYLFGGLAAMLGLIAFALLILACSYWKISTDGDGDLESGNGAGDGDSKPDNNNNNKDPHVYEEKYVVIMAGEVKPTFLATAVSSRTSSFGSCSCRSDSTASTDISSFPEEEKYRGVGIRCKGGVQIMMRLRHVCLSTFLISDEGNELQKPLSMVKIERCDWGFIVHRVRTLVDD